ncbi:MAG: methyltransferase [Hoeflea sp.]|uniref:methyltransferase n=1 Tax=Hoeflea sp. TaxID=1940281 RepID=UPI001D7651F1|nr:methyltransferase [Hoeflea sp.]MBU4531205.1 methyltransferase [Alphaproteobacteria bacterium]MBU4545733.1 methyltransferase [Alphaproteobacteria bacterium]MBU4550702.1 methyltransferase [Alphaproteobacteria bacterium]MBV1724482.1 methyltransferase [Hoeflea sp.]MBV1760502.1 methyltransferase [Hoeflea sp.]
MTSHQLSSGDLTADRRAQYARLYAEGGDISAAIDLQTQALELAPLWAAGWHQLGQYREKAGDMAGAADAWRKVLALAPADIFGAGLKLSLTGQAETPPAPPSEYVEALFDGYSDRFDTALVEDLGYCVPERLTALLGEVAGADAHFAKVTDLGCGTGLFGERIRLRTSWLDGYDLSQGMLAKAAEKGVYDHLGQADIGFGLPADAPAFGQKADLVAASDVFAYFGDLDTVIGVAADLIRPGGLLAFSCEAGDEGSDWLLQASLRYCHGDCYLRALMERHGLSIERLVREPIRRDGTAMIEGFLVIARRQGAESTSPLALPDRITGSLASPDLPDEAAVRGPDYLM